MRAALFPRHASTTRPGRVLVGDGEVDRCRGLVDVPWTCRGRVGDGEVDHAEVYCVVLKLYLQLRALAVVTPPSRDHVLKLAKRFDLDGARPTHISPYLPMSPHISDLDGARPPERSCPAQTLYVYIALAGSGHLGEEEFVLFVSVLFENVAARVAAQAPAGRGRGGAGWGEIGGERAV